MKKDEQTIPVKKLPPLFKKRYTEKALKKKILSRLYIVKDKQFAASLFQKTEGEKKPYAIAQNALFTKADAANIKRLAKQIKSQRGRIRLVPLAAAAGFIVLLVSAVLAFKDPLAKMGLQRALEGIFGAKCDIARVSVKILDSSVTINSLAVANKNNTMRNLFEMERIAVDFDLTQILRGRFVAELFEVSGVQANTGRKTDGALPPKRKKAPAAPSPLSPVVAGIQTFSAGAKERAAQSVTGIFASYNPETIIQGLFARLQSPTAVDKIKPQMDALIPAWKETPARVTASVTGLVQSGQQLAALDVNALKSDPVKIAQAVKDVTALVDKTKALRNETQTIVSRLDTDAKAVASLSRDVQRAVDADMKLVNGEIAKIRAFSIADGKNLLTGAFDTVLADALGKYYPYARRAFDLAEEYLLSDERKQKAAEKKAAREAQIARRSAGRTVLYRKDVPKFLIKKMLSSGKTSGFSLEAQITDISSDMELWGKPVGLQVTSVHGDMAESVIAALDVREKRSEPLFWANYTGSGYRVNLALPQARDVPGVPSISGTSAFTAKIAFDAIDNFSLEGTARVNPAVVAASAFEPAFASELYNRVLASFTSVNAGFSAAFAPQDGLRVKINSTIDETLRTALTREVNAQLAALKDNAIKQAKAELDKATGGLTAQFSDFSDMQKQILAQSAKLADYQKSIEAKLAELQNSAKSQAEDKVRDAATNALQNLLPGRR